MDFDTFGSKVYVCVACVSCAVMFMCSHFHSSSTCHLSNSGIEPSPNPWECGRDNLAILRPFLRSHLTCRSFQEISSLTIHQLIGVPHFSDLGGSNQHMSIHVLALIGQSITDLAAHRLAVMHCASRLVGDSTQLTTNWISPKGVSIPTGVYSLVGSWRTNQHWFPPPAVMHIASRLVG